MSAAALQVIGCPSRDVRNSVPVLGQQEPCGCFKQRCSARLRAKRQLSPKFVFSVCHWPPRQSREPLLVKQNDSAVSRALPHVRIVQWRPAIDRPSASTSAGLCKRRVQAVSLKSLFPAASCSVHPQFRRRFSASSGLFSTLPLHLAVQCPPDGSAFQHAPRPSVP